LVQAEKETRENQENIPQAPPWFHHIFAWASTVYGSGSQEPGTGAAKDRRTLVAVSWF
jgi:hypothetical protein